MRFNSVKGGDYSSGARAVNRNSDAAFDASRKSSFDFTGVSNAAIRARSIERQAAKKAEALKDRTQIKADTLVEGTQLKVDTEKKVADIKRPAKRMAGVVGALGSIAGGFVMKADKAAEKADRAARDARELKRDQQMLAILNKPDPVKEDVGPRPEHPGLKPKPDAVEPTATSSSPTPSPSPSPTATPPGSGSMQLTDGQESLAKAVRQVEVGDLGYDGFNQFGDAGGHSNRGTGGRYGDRFGTSLTNMSIADVMKKQSRHNDKSLSDADWTSSGGIWAAGAYQFIPETLKGVVERSGIDINRPFDKATQDELFKFHAGEIKGGKIGSTWIGMQNYSQAERDRYNQMLQDNF